MGNDDGDEQQRRLEFGTTGEMALNSINARRLLLQIKRNLEDAVKGFLFDDVPMADKAVETKASAQGILDMYKEQKVLREATATEVWYYVSYTVKYVNRRLWVCATDSRGAVHYIKSYSRRQAKQRWTQRLRHFMTVEAAILPIRPVSAIKVTLAVLRTGSSFSKKAEPEELT